MKDWGQPCGSVTVRAVFAAQCTDAVTGEHGEAWAQVQARAQVVVMQVMTKGAGRTWERAGGASSSRPWGRAVHSAHPPAVVAQLGVELAPWPLLHRA